MEIDGSSPESPLNTQRNKKGLTETIDENTISLLVSKVESLENQVIQQSEYIEDLLKRINYLEENRILPDEYNANFPALTMNNDLVEKEKNHQPKEVNCTWGKKVIDFLNSKQKATEGAPKIELTNEIKRKVAKKNASLIAFNVPESGESKKEDNWKLDAMKIAEVFKTLNIDTDNIINTFRFKKNLESGKIPPIRIILKGEEVKNLVLKKAPSLRNSEYNKIWLKPDLNENELIERKKLITLRDKQNEIMKEKYNDELKCVITRSNSLRIIINEKRREKENNKGEQEENNRNNKENDDNQMEINVITPENVNETTTPENVNQTQNEESEDQTQGNNVKKSKKKRGKKSYDELVAELKALKEENANKKESYEELLAENRALKERGNIKE
jgi:hypothetical protein